MAVLVSDANVMIDVVRGGLIDMMFQLDHQFITPDILFHQELSYHHPELKDKGLQLTELTAASLQRVVELQRDHRSISRMDVAALVLAMQKETPLLTGDRKLKDTATAAGIEVRGTLWLVEEMIINDQIAVHEARQAYQRMLNAGSRLPEHEIERQLRTLGD